MVCSALHSLAPDDQYFQLSLLFCFLSVYPFILWLFFKDDCDLCPEIADILVEEERQEDDDNKQINEVSSSKCYEEK